MRVLHIYIDRTAGFRKSEQLFISWSTPHKGKPLMKQWLSHWLMEAIIVAYKSKGLQTPASLRAHSTRGLASSWALFHCISLEDICAAASWATPHTFTRIYMTASLLSLTVLSAGSMNEYWKKKILVVTLVFEVSMSGNMGGISPDHPPCLERGGGVLA